MSQSLDLETKAIQRFINQDRRERYLRFVASPRNRHKFIRDLSHGHLLQWDLFTAVNGIEERIIRQALQQNGISEATCYVISQNSLIDTQTLTIKQAVGEVVGADTGAILVFGDAEMIFVEMEGLNHRYLSRKVTTKP